MQSGKEKPQHLPPRMNTHSDGSVYAASGTVTAAADGLGCDVSPQEKRCTDRDVLSSHWTSAEEMTLVQYMQHAFEPNFNALGVQSLLPTKSEQDIQQKWKELTASLLSSLSPEHVEQQPSTQQANEDNPPRKKKRQKLADAADTEEWTEEEDLQLLIQIMESQYSCKLYIHY